MKKSIVLLISLLFITAISLIILKNIGHSEKLISYSNATSSLVQIQKSIDNIDQEIERLFTKSGYDMDQIFELIPETLPLSYGNISANISLELLEPSLYYVLDENTTKNIAQYDLAYIVDPYSFENMVAKKNATNQQQVDILIEEYADYIRDDSIYEIKDKFIPFKIDENGSYIRANYDVNINNLSAKVSSVLQILDGKAVKKLYNVVLRREE